MALVTPGRIRAVYRMLQTFPPFSRWALPHPEVVACRLVDDLNTLGGYNRTPGGTHVLEINPHTILTLGQLVETVAHEMAHMRQEIVGRRPAIKSPNDQHNREFYRLARLICRDLGFDPARF